MFRFKGVVREFWGSSKGVSGGKFIAGFKRVTRLIQEDSLGVPRMIVCCSKGASWECKGCVKGVRKLVKEEDQNKFYGQATNWVSLPVCSFQLPNCPQRTHDWRSRTLCHRTLHIREASTQLSNGSHIEMASWSQIFEFLHQDLKGKKDFWQ